jgi:nitrous oxide reductase accessory protein NosL
MLKSKSILLAALSFAVFLGSCKEDEELNQPTPSQRAQAQTRMYMQVT